MRKKLKKKSQFKNLSQVKQIANKRMEIKFEK
jgi:hypothetical protein